MGGGATASVLLPLLTTGYVMWVYKSNFLTKLVKMIIIILYVKFMWIQIPMNSIACPLAPAFDF